MRLDTELSQISGVGPKFTTKLAKLDIKTVKDLLWHFPFRYEDYSKTVPIGDLKVNQSATIQGKVHQISTRRTWKKNLLITEAIIVDDTGGIKAVWFNQPYVQNILREGNFYNFAGKVTKSKREIYLASPSHEPIGASGRGEAKHTSGLIPIYPETRGLTSKGLRFLIQPLLKQLDKLEDFIPETILKKNKLADINIALRRIHFPLKPEDSENSKRRFAFEDLFLLQLNNLRYKSKLSKTQALPIEIKENDLKKILNDLPFTLTKSQNDSLNEILGDLKKSHPMNRLLQGDVGSGKTIIAAVAAIFVANNGLQAAFMAPTEVLAGQHYRTLTGIFSKFKSGVALLTANSAEVFDGKKSKSVTKAKLKKEIAEGNIKIIIGTHAIIQKNIKFKKMALAIVDEQHRFGVRQRAALQNSANKIDGLVMSTPHFLSMSATPIPRTLSLTVFGDLDLSTITELPSGRKQIITKLVDPKDRKKAYKFIEEQVKEGRQIFVICPRVEKGAIKEGEIVTDAKKKALELKSVKEEYEKLSTKVFPKLRVAMLHGKMKGKEKDQIMKDFKEHKYDILVSTSVIEVGVDVPNATIMMIEGSERFGLAQLYQFRGRVGRGEYQSYTFLFTDSGTDASQKRLNFLMTAKNGFELAEKDLALRGPGQFLGDNQAGLPDVAMDALKDIKIIKATRDAAKEILDKDPEIKNYPALNKKLEEFQKDIHLE